MHYRLGVDGGGTKTEAILIDASGSVAARATSGGCNPSIAGAEAAKKGVAELLKHLLTPFPTAKPDFAITATLLCMAGNRGFWQEFAASLTTFGKVTATDDSVPVLELATKGGDGIVLHAGTGSFVAARTGETLHYAGGLGWRFGDPGSGYDISRRAVARALLELQGWLPPSGLSAFVQEQTGLKEAQAISRFFYNDSTANPKISQLAPGIVNLAEGGNQVAQEILLGSAGELLELAVGVAGKLFPRRELADVPSGLSGPILTNPFVADALSKQSPLRFTIVTDAPIEGVRRLLARL